MNNQSIWILAIALGAGAFAAGCTWLSADLLGLLGDRFAARREQKRLEAEAKAAKKAEDAAKAKE